MFYHCRGLQLPTFAFYPDNEVLKAALSCKVRDIVYVDPNLEGRVAPLGPTYIRVGIPPIVLSAHSSSLSSLELNQSKYKGIRDVIYL